MATFPPSKKRKACFLNKWLHKNMFYKWNMGHSQRITLKSHVLSRLDTFLGEVSFLAQLGWLIVSPDWTFSSFQYTNVL